MYNKLSTKYMNTKNTLYLIFRNYYRLRNICLLVYLAFTVTSMVLFSYSSTQAEEIVADQDCTAAVANAEQLIEKGRRVDVILGVVNISQNYPDHPHGRPYGYIFGMRGPSTISILQSPQYMKIIARKVLKNCTSVSAVIFGVDSSGYSVYVGIFPSGKIDFFECLDINSTSREKPKWGQEYCND